MFSIISQFTEAQTDLSHYYIKVDGKDQSSFKLEYGQITYNDKFYPERKADQNITSLDEMITTLYSKLAEENTAPKLNVFIHGIWADSRFAWEEMVQNISRDCYDNKDGKQKVVLSIIWDSSVLYKKGVKIARNKGDFLSSFLANLLNENKEDYKVSFLCHSMGNRIFQHMINESDLIKKNEKVIDHYVSVAADVESNIFEDGEPLEGLAHIINDITIYIHNNDRTLGVSKLLNDTKRLGLHGVPDITALPDNMRTIDVSLIKDNDDFSSKIGNHRYFYMSPSVRNDLKRVIWEKDFSTSKQEMKHSRRLKLLPEQNTK